MELRAAIASTAKELGIDPIDLATAFSYETAGTFDPWKKGPKTKWGRHRGLIQWGEPQAAKYGVDENTSITDQVKAAGRYLVDAGVKPGHKLLDIYSAINAGSVGKYDASDEAAGGAPGTVRDKVETQMAGHRAKAEKLMADARKKVTDPAVLEQLNAAPRKKVSDPALLAELNGGKPAGHNVPEYVPPGVEGYDPATGEVKRDGIVDKIGAFLTGVSDLPIVGPAITKGQRYLASQIAANTFDDRPAEEIEQGLEKVQSEAVADNPGYNLAGKVTGALGTLIPAGATAVGGRLLGVTGNSLLGRSLASGASNAALTGTDLAVRDAPVGDALTLGGISGLIGAAIPGAGRALGSVGSMVSESIAPRVNSLLRPGYEAQRRVGNALQRDAANAPVINQADEASAALNQQELLNVDRGGEVTRALARSAANTDPEARALITRTVDDRFGSQGDRAQSFIQRIMGGATDDLAVQEQLKTAARATNRPAYEKAYRDGETLTKTPELERLMGSPAVVTAMKNAIKSGKDRAVKDGFGTFNPAISITDDGRIVFNRTNQAGGTTFPNLQFWDYTKQELDDMASAAMRSGKTGEASTIQGLSRSLREELDTVVHSYRDARAGAAAFFGAEDALDAGRKFMMQNRTIPETAAALKKMSRPERASFAVGFASEMKDAIAQAGDRTNVINKIFGSQQARAKIELALGQKAAAEFEQFVKVEHAMDLLRGAMGNSTTARQLAELGLAGGAGAGAGMLTGDWKQGLTVGALTGLARRYGAKVDDRVTKRVAELLLSKDPKAIEKAITIASNSPKAAAAVDAIRKALESATKIGGNASLPASAEPRGQPAQ